MWIGDGTNSLLKFKSSFDKRVLKFNIFIWVSVLPLWRRRASRIGPRAELPNPKGANREFGRQPVLPRRLGIEIVVPGRKSLLKNSLSQCLSLWSGCARSRKGSWHGAYGHWTILSFTPGIIGKIELQQQRKELQTQSRSVLLESTPVAPMRRQIDTNLWGLIMPFRKDFNLDF